MLSRATTSLKSRLSYVFLFMTTCSFTVWSSVLSVDCEVRVFAKFTRFIIEFKGFLSAA